MEARNTSTRIYKLTLAVVIVAITAAILRCQLDAAAGCGLFYNLAWTGLQAVRPAIQGIWHCLPAYVCIDSSYLERLPRVASSLWPLAGLLGG